MAVISKSDVPIAGAYWKRVISCDSKGNFSATLPPHVALKLGMDEVKGKSLYEIENEWRKASDQFDSLMTEKKKIIIYAVKKTARIYRDEKCIFDEDEIAFTNGLPLEIQAAVFIEEKIGLNDGKFRYNYELQKSKLPKSLLPKRIDGIGDRSGRRQDSQIEWTQEREDFFIKLGIGLENIVIELEKLKQPENVMQIIEAGAFKLLT